jgi:prepilin-type processing-associated H-X9-DG protein
MHSSQRAKVDLTFFIYRAGLVLSIVFVTGIVVAILFPVYFGRHTDRILTCPSNLRQIGLALLEYAQDYDEKLPSGLKTDAPGYREDVTGLGWASQLYTYVKDPEVFVCPEDDTPTDLAQGDVISYAYNSNAARNPDATHWTTPANSVELFEVAQSYCTLESMPNLSQLAYGPLAPVGDGTQPGLRDGRQSPSTRYATGDIGSRNITSHTGGRHDTGAYYLMADGHVSWLKPYDVSSGTTASFTDATQTGTSSGQAAGISNILYAATFSTK